MTKVIYNSATIQVVEHRAGENGVLIGPPDAGHGDGLLDYGPGQSIIEQALLNTSGGVHHIRWKGATQATKNTSIDDKVRQTLVAMDGSNSRNLIGLCQAGWLFARVATQFPSLVDSLTVAGAPIDTSLGESVLSKAQEMPIACYEWVVMMNGGIMPGWLMNMCWKISNTSENPDQFYKWSVKTQDLAGKWYLEIMKELFLDNTFKDTLAIRCPVNIAVGLKDDVVPPLQSQALELYCENAPGHYECDSDHLDLFMAPESMDMWADVFRGIGV